VNGALQLLAVLLPALYLLDALLHGMVFGGPRAPQVVGLRRWTLRITLVLHVLYFAVRARALGHFPVSDLWSTLSAVGLSVAALYAWIARREKHAGTGGVALGAVCVLQLIASAFGPIEPVARAAGMPPFQIVHVGTGTLALAALVLSGVHGILYLVLFRQMRARRFGALFENLPDLDVLARMTRASALAGFVFLTVGVNGGIAMAHAEHAPGFSYLAPGSGYLAPEVLLSIALWIHFGVIAFSRHIRGFSARRASFAAAGGLVALVLSLLLVLFPHLSFHSGV
jgi:ABC-type uncharacterized transport system permease subunit